MRCWVRRPLARPCFTARPGTRRAAGRPLHPCGRLQRRALPRPRGVQAGAKSGRAPGAPWGRVRRRARGPAPVLGRFLVARCPAVACRLRPSHPRSAVVAAETFSPSVLREYLLLPSRSGPAGAPRGHARALPRPGRHALPVRDSGAWAAGCSALHFPGALIRQVGCDTLLRGCRPLWPPPCCRDQRTPFVSAPASRAVAPLKAGSSSPARLTRGGPLATRTRRALPPAEARVPALRSLRAGAVARRRQSVSTRRSCPSPLS